MRAFFYLTHEQYLEIIGGYEQRDKKLRELIVQYPNDMELGEQVRKLFDETNGI